MIAMAMRAQRWNQGGEVVGRLSPYIRDHLRRFGEHVLDMDDLPPPLVLRLLGIADEGAG